VLLRVVTNRYSAWMKRSSIFHTVFQTIQLEKDQTWLIPKYLQDVSLARGVFDIQSILNFYDTMWLLLLAMTSHHTVCSLPIRFHVVSEAFGSPFSFGCSFFPERLVYDY
jgi:hypothetical protein